MPKIKVIAGVLTALAFGTCLTSCDRKSSEGDPSKRYCPNDINPPAKVVGLSRITSIVGFRRALAARDDTGQMWVSYRGEVCSGARTWRVAAKFVSPHALLHPRLDRFASITGGHDGGLATTSTGEIVGWYASQNRNDLDFEGIAGISPSCDESPYNCLNQRRRVPDIAMVGNGAAHQLVLRKNGEVWSQGWNDCGQLGRAGEPSRPGYLPAGRIEVLRDIVAVAAGHRNSLALQRDGTVWEWGSTASGLLLSEEARPAGDAAYCSGFPPQPYTPDHVDDAPHNEPHRVAGLRDVTAIATFYAANFALKADGTVWGWGQNISGQLAQEWSPSRGATDVVATPVQVEGLPRIQAIAPGKRHVLALGLDGQVWAWGDNRWTALGSTDVVAWSSKPVKVPGLPKITAIAAAYHFSAALAEDGSVWVWGRH